MPDCVFFKFKNRFNFTKKVLFKIFTFIDLAEYFPEKPALSLFIKTSEKRIETLF